MNDISVNSERLKDLMLRRKVGDSKLAELSGLGRTTIYYLRSGQTKATSERNLRTIAAALDTTVAYLSGEGEAQEDSERVAVLLTEPIRQLAEVANSLSEIRQEELIRMARALVELEREQFQSIPSSESMDALIDIYNDIKAFAGGADPIVTLQAFLRASTGKAVLPAESSKGIGNHLQ